MTITILSYLIPSAVFLFYVSRYEGRKLKNKFKKLGDLHGMQRQQIIIGVGNPDSVSVLSNGIQLLRWDKFSYHIALQFDNEGNYKDITCES